jgi:hypothetical protein
MWIVITRPPRPEASIWPGRRALAAIDAVAWPLMWVVAVRHVPASTGLVGPVACSIAALSGVTRLHRALWANERYWFTTWRWSKIAAAMLLMGWVLKLAMAV